MQPISTLIISPMKWFNMRIAFHAARWRCNENFFAHKVKKTWFFAHTDDLRPDFGRWFRAVVDTVKREGCCLCYVPNVEQKLIPVKNSVDLAGTDCEAREGTKLANGVTILVWLAHWFSLCTRRNFWEIEPLKKREKALRRRTNSEFFSPKGFSEGMRIRRRRAQTKTKPNPPLKDFFSLRPAVFSNDNDRQRRYFGHLQTDKSGATNLQRRPGQHSPTGPAIVTHTLPSPKHRSEAGLAEIAGER